MVRRLASLSAFFLLAASGVGCTVRPQAPDAFFDVDANFQPDTGPVCTSPMRTCSGVCTDVMADTQNCGTCGHACASGQGCMGGTCMTVCTDGAMPGLCNVDDGSGHATPTCVDMSIDAFNCGHCGTVCGGDSQCVGGACTCLGGQISCGGHCVDQNTDPSHCGDCLSSCGTGGTCSAGRCTACGGGLDLCGAPRARCVDTQTSTLHCGTCGMACPARAVCNAGSCECPTSAPMICGDSCADLMTDTSNCGVCGIACPINGVCNAGVCGCPAGWMQCGDTCVDLMNDETNCGTCGTHCPTNATCTAGSCACSTTGYTACGGVCLDTQTDVTNCGACGTDCGAHGSCSGGACGCTTGYTLCGTHECDDLMTDRVHCGSCTNPCAVSEGCHGGTCVASDTFRVVSLTTTGCVTVDQTNARGDDRGGVALSDSTFFVNTDTTVLALPAADLGSIAPLAPATQHDGIVSDLATGQVYVLMTATAEITASTSAPVVTQLGVLDGTTGALTATRIALSSSITLASGTAIMSGDHEALVGVLNATSLRRQWFRIQLPSGTVTTLGTTPNPTHRGCELASSTWWGIAERSSSSLHAAVFVESTTRISRLVIPDVGTSTNMATPIATFTNLGDMCSITFSETRNRWYFHNESTSQLTPTGFEETAGYCDGTFERP